MYKENSSKNFAMSLKVEDSGIFHQGWLPDELKKVEVICRQQSYIESGMLAAVALKGSSTALLKRVYNIADSIVLEAPKNLDRPNEVISPIVFSKKEAEEKLTVLGKVVKFYLSIKEMTACRQVNKEFK